MQVIEFKEFGSPSQLGLAERPLPQADANTAVVRIEAAAVNPQRLENMQDAYRRQLCLAYQGGIVRRGGGRAEAVDRPGGVGFGR